MREEEGFRGVRLLAERNAPIGAWALLLFLLPAAGVVIAGCGNGDVPTATGPAPPPAPSPAPPPQPEPSRVTVSFAEDSRRLGEGETIEIGVKYSGADAGNPLRIAVLAENETADADDYELVTPTLQIPPLQEFPKEPQPLR